MRRRAASATLHPMTRVLIAGAGVAAVECALALRELAGSAVEIDLLAPAAELVYRPASVTTPFGAEAAPRIDLAGLGVQHRRDALAAVSPATHEVLTRDGERVGYDRLVVATGARSREAVPGAVTFRGPLSAGAMERVLSRVTAEPELRVAFAAPAGATWPLPLYELALLTAATLRERGIDPDLTVVATDVFDGVLGALDHAGIDVVTGTAAAAVEGTLRLDDGRVVGADLVVALPVLVGPRISGLPHDAAGFLEIDEHGRVRGCADVFAAGDATAFPIKHGSLAAAQADAIAETIAGVADPAPFRPLLQGLLLTGADPLYIRAEPGGATTTTTEPLWSPPVKIVGRYLTPFLAAV
jgi:sulfide:quinone oxidoreductase